MLDRRQGHTEPKTAISPVSLPAPATNCHPIHGASAVLTFPPSQGQNAPKSYSSHLRVPRTTQSFSPIAISATASHQLIGRRSVRYSNEHMLASAGAQGRALYLLTQMQNSTPRRIAPM
jgi:hypothetical protein